MKRYWVIIILALLALIGSTVATFAAGSSEIPALPSTAPQVVVYRDSGQWIVKIPTDSGDVFVQAKKIPSCPPAKSVTLQPGDYVLHGPAVLNGWTNRPGQDQSEWKLLINEWDNFSFIGVGGTLWQWNDACSPDVIQQEFNRNPLRSVTVAELRSRGLLQ